MASVTDLLRECHRLRKHIKAELEKLSKLDTEERIMARIAALPRPPVTVI